MNDVKKSVLDCRSISKEFVDGKRTVTVLKEVNLSIQTGECIAIIGVSGSGKSTLLHIMGGLEKPTGGEVFINGRDINKMRVKEQSRIRNSELGFIYQFHHLLPEFTALENVAMPLLIQGI